MTGPDNTLAIVFFFLFVALTLGITYGAARRTRTTSQFFAADGQITACRTGGRSRGTF